MEISKNISECAFHIDNKNTCMESHIINKLQELLKEKKIITNTEKDTIDKLKMVYDCDTETCILKKDEIANILTEEEIKEQLDKRFKIKGPLNKDKWLSNFDIDGVLEQIEKKYKHRNFKHINFQMRDFQEICSDLAKIDFVEEYKKGIRCFGVVFNDDVSSGGGTHWTAMYGDFSKEPFTIEHFNSSGAGPKNEFRIFMTKLKYKLEKELNKRVHVKEVSKIKHQLENSACGVYSLYYIISRLEGISYSVFEKYRIPDELMDKFRFHLFRKE